MTSTQPVKKRMQPTLISTSTTMIQRPIQNIPTEGRMLENKMLMESEVIGSILRKMQKKEKSSKNPKTSSKAASPAKKVVSPVKVASPVKKASESPKLSKKEKSTKKSTNKKQKEKKCKILRGQGGRRYVLDYNKKKVYLDPQHKNK